MSRREGKSVGARRVRASQWEGGGVSRSERRPAQCIQATNALSVRASYWQQEGAGVRGREGKSAEGGKVSGREKGQQE